MSEKSGELKIDYKQIRVLREAETEKHRKVESQKVLEEPKDLEKNTE